MDKACSGQKFIHNPGAYDIQGDSLSYEIVVPKQGENLEVEDYRDPDNVAFSQSNEDRDGSASFYMDPITGDLIWDAPSVPGEYNVAFLVHEYREGVLIGSINRDMQIEVIGDCDNLRPRINVPNDTCVIAGAKIRAVVDATDADEQFVDIIAQNEEEGAIFDLSSPSNAAAFNIIEERIRLFYRRIHMANYLL